MSPGESFSASTTSFGGSSKGRVVRYNPLNSFNPIYNFSTDEIVAVKGRCKYCYLSALDTD